MRWPSGENVTPLSMSRTIICGVPPSTGSTVQIPLALRADAGFTKVDVISVRRKGQGTINRRCRRDNLSVTAGGNVAQPQALQAIIVLHVQDVLAVGGYRSLFSLPVFVIWVMVKF